MTRNSGLKWMCYAAAVTWLWLALFSCATTPETQQALVQSMAEKAGIICATYLPEQRTKINTMCALTDVLSNSLPPAEVQKALQEQISALWVAGGEAGAWLVATTLNDLVRFSGLQTKVATSESVKQWTVAMDAFCAGVETVK